MTHDIFKFHLFALFFDSFLIHHSQMFVVTFKKKKKTKIIDKQTPIMNNSRIQLIGTTSNTCCIPILTIVCLF